MPALILSLCAIIFIFWFYWLIKSDDKPNASTNTQKIYDLDLSKYTYYDEFEVTGIHVDNRKNYILQFINLKYPIKLQHEKVNEYSNTAVQVLHDGFVLGYIRDEDSDEVMNISFGDYFAYVSQKYLDGTYLTLYIKVFFN